MRAATSPFSLALLILGVGALAFSNYPLAVVFGLGWLIVVSFIAMKSAQSTRIEQSAGDSLKLESQGLLRPVRKLAEEMREMVAGSPRDGVVAAMGKDVVSEADRLVAECVASLTARDELKRLLAGKYNAQKEIDRVTEAQLSASTDTEKQALQAALEARKSEMAHYDEIDTALKKIDADMRQAEAALAEMKARLSLVATQGGQLEANSDQLRESLQRVRAVTMSVDEAEQLIKG